MPFAKRPWILVTLLFALEQGIKLVINKHYLHADRVLIKHVLFFRPVFNRDYSWFNSLLGLNISRAAHIILVIVLLALIYIVFQYVQSLNQADALVNTAFAFIFAGALCSLVDKVFWDGSLDYIYVRGFFTFDLKDVYINVFIILLLLMLAINHQRIRQVNEEEALRGLWDYINSRIKK